MNTTYTLAEFNSVNTVGTLAALTDDELRHHILIAERMLAKYERIFEWFSDVILDELKLRHSQGKRERGLVSLPYRFSVDDFFFVAQIFFAWSHLESISQNERAWVKSVAETAITILSVKAQSAPANGRPESLLTTSDVLDALNISREQLARMVKQGQVPKPIRIGPRTFRWHPADILLMLPRDNNTE
jgi:predicted DNA-binding transcriptional regulator AlpA